MPEVRKFKDAWIKALQSNKMSLQQTTTPVTTTAVAFNDSLVFADPQFKAATAIGKYALLPIYIVGTLGNLLSFIIMLRRPMRVSSTAFYMASLAMADNVVLLVGCLRRWVFEFTGEELLYQNEASCYAVNFLQYWAFDVSVWILVAMTIDRTIVVTQPLKAQFYATKKRAIIATVVVMVLCAAINIHLFFTTTFMYDEVFGKYCGPATSADLDFHNDVWPWIDAVIYSFLPFTLLLIMNVIIIVTMTRANTRKRNMTAHFVKKRREEQSNTISPAKLTVMLLSVTFAFVLLTGPSMIHHIFRKKTYDDESEAARYILIRQIVRVMMYTNHGINFYLYCVTGSKFRRELVAMFSCRSARDRRRELMSKTSMASITTTETTIHNVNRRNGVSQSEDEHQT